MKIRFIKPSYEIDMLGQTGIEKLKAIEQKGKICYKAEHNITDDSYLKFIKMIVDNKHHSVLEHASVSFKFICDRGVSHELVRHRAGIGFSQESTRYCTYNDTMEFIIPSWMDIEPFEWDGWESSENKEVGLFLGTWQHPCMKYHWKGTSPEYLWVDSVARAARDYELLLRQGWKAQQARSVLPNSLKTEIWSTCNLREMRHIFQLRTAPAAHPDFRALSIPLLAEMKQLIPIVFDDI